MSAFRTTTRGPLGNTNAKKHGHQPKGKPSRTYISWLAMLERCRNPKRASFKWYGARGITVCDRWLTFANFLEDMGERPPAQVSAA